MTTRKQITREKLNADVRTANYAIVSYMEGDLSGTVVGIYRREDVAKDWASFMQDGIRPDKLRFEVEEIVD